MRYLAATNRSPRSLIAEGKLREDLYHRISGRKIELPALRDRAEDIPVLARHFLGADVAALTPDALRPLQAYHWPGNVRELMSVLVNARERAACRGERWIRPEDIESAIGKPQEAEGLGGEVEKQRAIAHTHLDLLCPKTPLPLERSASEDSFYVRGTLEDIEGQVIRETLRRTGNNQSEAARRLGIDRKTLWARLKHSDQAS